MCVFFIIIIHLLEINLVTFNIQSATEVEAPATTNLWEILAAEWQVPLEVLLQLALPQFKLAFSLLFFTMSISLLLFFVLKRTVTEYDADAK